MIIDKQTKKDLNQILSCADSHYIDQYTMPCSGLNKEKYARWKQEAVELLERIKTLFKLDIELYLKCYA